MRKRGTATLAADPAGGRAGGVNIRMRSNTNAQQTLSEWSMGADSEPLRQTIGSIR